MDCSLPSSSVHRISQARVLEWVTISFSGGSSQLRVGNLVSCISRWVLYCLTSQGSPGVPYTPENSELLSFSPTLPYLFCFYALVQIVSPLFVRPSYPLPPPPSLDSPSSPGLSFITLGKLFLTKMPIFCCP